MKKDIKKVLVLTGSFILICVDKDLDLFCYLGNKSLLCTKFSNAMYPTGTKII